MKINMNNLVKFKLTEKGEEVLYNYSKKQFDELYGSYPNLKPIPAYDTIDKYKTLFIKNIEDGYQEAMLWELFNIYGGHMYNGGPIMFKENSIEINNEVKK